MIYQHMKMIANSIAPKDAVLYYLGLVNDHTGKIERAKTLYKEALTINPFLWCAMERLCKLGPTHGDNVGRYGNMPSNENAQPENTQKRSMQMAPHVASYLKQANINQIFDLRNYQNGAAYRAEVSNDQQTAFIPKTGYSVQQPQPHQQSASRSKSSHQKDDDFHSEAFQTPARVSGEGGIHISSKKKNKSGDRRYSTSSTRSVLQPQSLSFATPSPKLTPNISRKSPYSTPIAQNLSSPTFSSSSSNYSTPQDSMKDDDMVTPSPLNNTTESGSKNPPPIRQTRQRARNMISTENSHVSFSQTSPSLQFSLFHPQESPAPNPSPTASPVGTSPEEILLHCFKIFAKAFCCSTLYDASSSNVIFKKYLPASQQLSGWVRCQIARNYFELEMYERAFKEYATISQMEPWRLDGMDVFSTTLWHLKLDKELSYLGQRLNDIDRHSPITLVAIGNSFSLYKDHERAIQFFQRAQQINPNYAYAFTLEGHEHLDADQVEKASKCYQRAIGIDVRHYNAWYGLGTVFHRREQYNAACTHFQRALQIKPNSSVMHCYLGITLKAMKNYGSALRAFDAAIRLMPSNPMTRFKRAETLIDLKNFNEALKELDCLRQLVPQEPYLFATLGDVHGALSSFSHEELKQDNLQHNLTPEEHKKDAIQHYQTALQMGFKDAKLLKEKI
eukprot:CAMPEP_0117418414 /NCGR_PEP_ID=MMETSP0758-20121206/199_1 /TAXON_ID=63605 /ORGANISM="Percolomonas cosmopolitus, Strain AE-1 (ATCC 50343)" /LENGTH=674 /DNA_ID=CAMNT_0005198901 /DNA_START=190 /DNA_END=2211 /DNA_ORIENTATION=+